MFNLVLETFEYKSKTRAVGLSVAYLSMGYGLLGRNASDAGPVAQLVRAHP